MKIREFSIEGLFGDRNVKLSFEGDALVLVGPNGLGKSSVASMFYLLVSRQWKRLVEYEFDAISINIDGIEFNLQREDISGLAVFKDSMKKTTSSPRVQRYIKVLNDENLMEEFLSVKRWSAAERTKFADLLGMPRDEPSAFQSWLSRKLHSEDDLFSAPRLRLERQLTSAISSRVLYLPTYRRIEKDLNDVFPGIEERFRRVVGADRPIEAGRSGEFFVEFVNFGMDDVKLKIEDVTQEVRNYSLSQYNNLSANYLRDVIRGQADKFTSKSLNALTEDTIEAILARVSEAALPTEDKLLLRSKIKSIQNRNKSDLNIEDKYLAHYFSRLVKITDDIIKKEDPISSFTRVCNKYIRPDKEFVYDEIKSDLKVYNDRFGEIDLRSLSSGEKQIVSLFSHLYLDERQQDIVIIDEPELSLSVPWQRDFLPDILESSPGCFVFAVTHSPFIYENKLKRFAVDLRRFTTIPSAK